MLLCLFGQLKCTRFVDCALQLFEWLLCGYVVVRCLCLVRYKVCKVVLDTRSSEWSFLHTREFFFVVRRIGCKSNVNVVCRKEHSPPYSDKVVLMKSSIGKDGIVDERKMVQYMGQLVKVFVFGEHVGAALDCCVGYVSLDESANECLDSVMSDLYLSQNLFCSLVIRFSWSIWNINRTRHRDVIFT